MVPDEKSAGIDRIVSPSRPLSLETTRNNPHFEMSDIEKAMSVHEDKDITTHIAQTRNPDIVDWDGPDDQENPLNWPAKRKWANIAILSTITLLTSVTPKETVEAEFSSLTDGVDRLDRRCLRQACPK